MREIKRIVIAGAGTMGSSMAQTFAKHGYDVTLYDVFPAALEKAKSLIELNVRAKVGVTILAVKRENEITVSPSADFRIQKDDTLVVLGDSTALKAMQKL